MMFEKTFEMMGRTFDSMREEFAKMRKEGMTVVSGEITVLVSNGCVEIRGPVKQLKMNGRLVRFKEDV